MNKEKIISLFLLVRFGTDIFIKLPAVNLTRETGSADLFFN